jgi:hypothetical protein
MTEKRLYEISVKSMDAAGHTHEAHAEVRSSDPADSVARGILESLQSQRGKDNVRIIDGDK